MAHGGLGRRKPRDDNHIRSYPFSLVAPTTVATVERTLLLPRWHKEWDQGREGACVGYGCSMMMSLLNRHRYDPRWLWNRAKEIDEWPDTNPGDDNGTSVRAACDVLRAIGHVRVRAGKGAPPSAAEGIQTNRWATTIDEMRTAIAHGLPVSIGVDWFGDFFTPEKVGREWWIGRGAWEQSGLEGGHCIVLRAASDRRQAFGGKNSWLNYPTFWLPYATMQRLLDRDGEACLVSDR